MSNATDPANVQWDNPNIPIAIGVSLGSGLATGIGGALVFFPELLKRIPQATILAISLALSAGVMIYVSFIEIFAKSLDAISSSPGISEGGATAITTVCFFIGMLFCVLLELLVHRMSKDDPVAHDVMCAAHGVPGAGLRTAFQANGAEQCCDDDDCEAHSSAANDAHSHEHSHAHEPGLAAAAAPPQVQIEIVNDSQAGDTPVSGKGGGNGKGKKSNASSESSTHSSSSTTLAVAKPSGDYSGDLIGNSAEQSGLKRMGLMTAAAIAIHNFPEGLATFLATVQDTSVGASLGVAIAVHNIPEGLCVAMPIYYATGSKWKGFFWSLLSGVTEPIGGILGFAALQPVFTDLVFGVIFSMVGGMMVFIVCHELLPAAHRYMGNAAKATMWLIIGMIIMATSLVLFVL